MRRVLSAVSVMLLAVIAGCVPSKHATATIRGTQPDSKISGSAVFTPTEHGIKAVIKIAGAPMGQHGIHIHEKGDCGDGGKAAGGHFNPANVKHGFLPKDGSAGAHAGDMGNITVQRDGTGSLTLELSGLTLESGPLGVVGRSVIFHEKVDNFGQPTGNAGGRIACGVIQMVNK